MSKAKTPTPRASLAEASTGRRAVHHPRRTEFVDEHTETLGPEGRCERHGHVAVVCQRVKYAFRLRWIGDLDRHGKSFGCLMVLRWNVGSQQDGIPYDE